MTRPVNETPAQSGWDGLLDPGEEILWQGRPDDAIRLRVGDYIMIGFGIVFGGFALVWMALASLAGGFLWMFGLLHFSVGAGVMLWPLLGRPYIRRHTWYTLTGKRAFIATDVPVRGKTLKSYPISADSPLTLKDGDPGSVLFAYEKHRTKNGYRETHVGFEYITDAREVYGLLRDIQRGAA
ncbi:aspartate carbamoyltransferase catalytic subunit [Antarctobacter sp.]|uniref:aspartate carbamoyltransferase catalytic subunit n=1 Tax=Antarctobacter sp. TaxID=1872577 RepID=UPI002B267D33|nr:aspartate carbamoyltransferase catalytic subunit [Antarctobacter sp.]